MSQARRAVSIGPRFKDGLVRQQADVGRAALEFRQAAVAAGKGMEFDAVWKRRTTKVGFEREERLGAAKKTTAKCAVKCAPFAVRGDDDARPDQRRVGGRRGGRAGFKLESTLQAAADAHDRGCLTHVNAEGRGAFG